MSRIASILACFAVASIFSFGARAFPVSPAPATQVAAPEVTLVRGFCGLGFHRGPYGGCVRHGVLYGYVAPPVYVGPPVSHLTAMMRGHYAYYGITGNFRRHRWSCRAHVPTVTTSMLPTA